MSDEQARTVTFFNAVTKSYAFWIGFDNVEHSELITKLRTVPDLFEVVGTVSRVKAEHFVEVADELAVGESEGLYVYLPGTYSTTACQQMIDALVHKKMPEFLKLLDIEDNEFLREVVPSARV